LSGYTDTQIAGYQLTYNPESLVWNTPNDIVEQRLTGRGYSTAYFGGAFMDTITFDGYVTSADMVQLLAYRDLRRIVTLTGDIVGQRYVTTQTIFCLIEDISFNEQAGFTTPTFRIYPYKFRLRKVGDYDHYKRCTIAQTTLIPHCFSFTAKPLIGLPTGTTSLSQSTFDIYTKLLLHLDGAEASTAISDDSHLAHTVTAGGAAKIYDPAYFGPNAGLTSTGSPISNTTLGETAGPYSSIYHHHVFMQVTAVHPGLITSVTCDSVSALTEAAVYSDNSGVPGTLLGYSTSASGTDPTTFTFTNCAVPSGKIWIAAGGTSPVKFREAPANDTQGYNDTSSSLNTNNPTFTSQTAGYIISCAIDYNQGNIQCMKMSVLRACNATSVSFYSHTTGNVRLAIYDDSSGPNNLVWSCGSTAVTAGWNVVNISSGSPTTLALSIATYWLGWQWSGTAAGPSYTAGSSGDGAYKAQAYGTFPNPISGTTSSADKWSMYVTTGVMATSKFSQCCVFDGSTAYLSSADSADWAFGTGDFTIDCWVMFDALPASGAIEVIWAHAKSSDPYHYEITLRLQNVSGTYTWTFADYQSGTNVDIRASAVSLSTGTWYHVAVARHSTSNWYIFQDGSSLTLTTTVGASNSLTDMSGNPVTIGSDTYAGRYLNGWLDEFRISKGIARWTSTFTPNTVPYNIPYRTGADGMIPYVANFVGNKLYYDIPEANMDLNNVTIVRSGDEVGITNGLVWIQSRNNEVTNIGNFDLSYYDHGAAAWKLLGQLEFQVYDSQWNSMSGAYCTIDAMVEDDPEYGSIYGVWQATSNDCAILCEIETWRGKPYFAVRITNAGSATINGVICRINVDATTWADTFRYWVHGTTIEDAQSGALGTPKSVSATGDDYAHTYLMSTSTIGFATIYAGLITRTRANGRNYEANDQGNSFSYVDFKFDGTNMSPVTTGNDLEEFWVYARYYESSDDDPTELAKECMAPVDGTQDLVKVS
jgi:hypothetical protein